jgi:hypothetical protein
VAFPDQQLLSFRVVAWPEELLPGHTVRLVAVGVDEYALRIDYEIQPPGGSGSLTWPSAAEDDASPHSTTARRPSKVGAAPLTNF